MPLQGFPFETADRRRLRSTDSNNMNMTSAESAHLNPGHRLYRALLAFLRADLFLPRFVADVGSAPHEPVNPVCELVQPDQNWNLNDVERRALNRRPLVYSDKSVWQKAGDRACTSTHRASGTHIAHS